jgi:hypothetical protein
VSAIDVASVIVWWKKTVGLGDLEVEDRKAWREVHDGND